MKTFGLSILLWSIFTQIPAQQQTTTNPPENKKFQLFYEKVYLHTDRSYYSSGDDIWFKAYLVNAISNIPMETSGNLYVDLISSESKIMDHKMIHLKNSYGFGDFQLKDSIPGGTYKIRAYTNWMRNFGEIFLFEKEIKIYSIPEIKPESKVSVIPQPTIQFFPESGSLISEAINTVAFKAIDENGNGCNAEGVIVSSDNDTISWFNTSYLGMGTLAFVPLAGQKYFASGKINTNQTFKTELPEPLGKGYGMQVTDYDTASFYVSIFTNQSTLDEVSSNEMIINAMADGKNCFTGQFAMNTLKKDIKISKKGFPNGVINITLYDSLLHPHCQRLIHISKNNNLKITVTAQKQNYVPREKVTLQIKVTDSNGLPVKTNLSLAAIDMEQVPADYSNIESYLNLESEIKGKIEKPSVYFDPTNPSRFKQLDLLLMTQGWRDFIWRRLKEFPLTITAMVEPGISISGRVRQKFGDKPIPGSMVSLYTPKATNGITRSTNTQDNGNFYFEGIEFYGTQSITLTSRDAKGKTAGWVLVNQPDSFRYPIKPFYYSNDHLISKTKFAEESHNRNNTLKKYSLNDTIHLDEVLVSAKKAREEKQITKFIMNGGTPDYIFSPTPEDYLLSVGQYLAMKIPRAQISTEATDDGPAPNDRILIRVNGVPEAPRFILDDFQMRKGDLIDESVIYNLSVQDIEKVLVSTIDVTGSGSSGYIIGIITNPNRSSNNKFYTLTKKYPGYYEARTFYSPVYPNQVKLSAKPDLRTTLFWEPNLETNAEGECTTSFYNTDKSMKVKYSFEGITESGIPIVQTGNYEVK